VDSQSNRNKAARIIQGATKALVADQRRGQTAARRQAHASTTTVVIRRMPVIDPGVAPGRQQP
jgi:hypothetical protein